MSGEADLKAFQAAVAEVLDVPSIGADEAFRSVPGWCSLQAFGLLVLLENDWQTPLTVEAFEKFVTVRDLYEATRTRRAEG